MIVKLLKDQRVWHKAGETVEVSPAEGRFLLSVRAAVKAEAAAVIEEKPAPKKKRTKKAEKAEETDEA